MIELKFTGDAADVRAEMMRLLGGKVFTPADVGPGLTGTTATTITDGVAAAEARDSSTEATATSKPARRTRQTKPQTPEGEVVSKTEASAQNISQQPENRVDPAAAEQDKADEAASEEKPGAKVYTLDDVHKAAKSYVDKWTLEAASVDLVPCLMKAVGVGKMSELAALNDAAKFEAAAKAIDAAVAATDKDGNAVRYPTEG